MQTGVTANSEHFLVGLRHQILLLHGRQHITRILNLTHLLFKSPSIMAIALALHIYFQNICYGRSMDFGASVILTRTPFSSEVADTLRFLVPTSAQSTTTVLMMIPILCSQAFWHWLVMQTTDLKARNTWTHSSGDCIKIMHAY